MLVRCSNKIYHLSCECAEVDMNIEYANWYLLDRCYREARTRPLYYRKTFIFTILFILYVILLYFSFDYLILPNLAYKNVNFFKYSKL